MVYGTFLSNHNQSKSRGTPYIPVNTMDPTLFHKFLIHSLVCHFFMMTVCTVFNFMVLLFISIIIEEEFQCS